MVLLPSISVVLIALATAAATEPTEPVEASEPAQAAVLTEPAERWLDSVLVLVTGSAWCSAVLIDDQGTVATAYHCVSSGRRPQLTTRDGVSIEARVVATAPRQDLALLEAPELAGSPWLEVRDGSARQGETVWALGHPFAPQADSSPLLAGTLQWSASRGVVSAVGQRLVQVDAALNPGNSGGPVVDDQGRIVGIASRRLSGDNIAFISPSSGIRALVNEPQKRLLGGTWGGTLVGIQGLDMDAAPSLGGALQLALRDRLIARAGLMFPINQRWTALSLGSSSWVAGEAAASLRLRLGHGRWSTTLDLGGTCLLVESVRADIADDAIHLFPAPTGIWPGAVASVGLGGSSLRWLVVQSDDGWTSMLGVELGYPGVLGVF